VPYTSSTIWGFGNSVPEIDPSDLQRVEVLRGPQGTLYGASSMGGLLKFVTIEPSTDGVSGRIQVGLSDVHNGPELGSSFRGSINVPINDVVAIRASAFTRQDPGYIDDPVHHINGVNSGKVSGGRLSALWGPSESFSLKLNALLQGSETHGMDIAQTQPGFGDLQQNAPPGSGGYRKTLQVYSANLSAKLGNAQLTAISAYIDNKNKFFWDFTPELGSLAPLCGCTGLTSPQTGVTSNQVVDTTKYTQEIRLSVPLSHRIEWLFGAFYDHEDTPRMFQSVPVVNFITGLPLGELAHLSYPNSFQEYAAFSDFTFHFTDRFDIQLGGRESHSKATLAQTTGGPLFGGADVSEPENAATGNAFTYLVTPRFKVSEDLMAYLRLASGYRPPGVNEGTAINPKLPPAYAPDKTQNYEIGVKGDVLGHAVSFDASLYYIDWKNIQINLQDPVTFLTYYINASRAKSEGVEFSVALRPWSGFTIGGWGAWDDATLTQDFPAKSLVIGRSGDRLPYSSRVSGSLSIDQQFLLVNGLTGFVGGSVAYVGDRRGDFQSSPDRQTFPAYSKTDLRVGVKYQSWAVNAFANNLSDKRGIVQSGIGTQNPNGYYFIQPRTVGLSLMTTF